MVVNINRDEFDGYNSHNMIIPNFIIQSARCSDSDWHLYYSMRRVKEIRESYELEASLLSIFRLGITFGRTATSLTA